MYGKVFGQAQRTDIKQKLSATYNITTRHALLVSPDKEHVRYIIEMDSIGQEVLSSIPRNSKSMSL